MPKSNSKPKSFRLSLYLATRARRALRQDTTPQSKQVDRPPGQLVWFHLGANSNANAVSEVAQRISLERDDLGFLITTSAKASHPRDGDLLVLPTPNDTVPDVRRFLEHWRPDVLIWAERQLRPALLSGANDRNIPMIMVDADKAGTLSAQNWPRSIAGDLIRLFSTIIARDRSSARVLRQTGASSSAIEILGPWVEGVTAPLCNEAERDDLASQLSGRPTWLAADIDDDELDAVVSAHIHAQRRAHRLLLILVPRNPIRGSDWAAKLIQEDQNVMLRSLGEEPETETQIYVADTEGELGLWYRLAPISFLGQSLVAQGGINPLPAASLGSAVIHGPNIQPHQDAYARLKSVGAARLVVSASELGRAVDELLSPARAAEMARQAWEITSSGAAVTDRIVDLVLTELEAQ